MVVGLIVRRMRATLLGIRIAIFVLVCYWVALFIGTHLPPRMVSSLHASDKLLHTIAFAGLAFFLAWALPTVSNRQWYNVGCAYGIGALYAGFDELSQIPVGRTADWYDFIADQFGLVIGLGIYAILRHLIIRFQLPIFTDLE